ncbi:hypothetical protein [Chondromyces crocatus]|uniref:Uncharacterized protein n=1 Tax=Chondromyces crocatus TaxID=52 RepID=A0A0K1E8J1_CHOCO|nr:hypothetical protein [Chondromyces crocatus]AKT37169.1 uncharacterized protein CMC5_012990 [Chondromyces crocatus]
MFLPLRRLHRGLFALLFVSCTPGPDIRPAPPPPVAPAPGFNGASGTRDTDVQPPSIERRTLTLITEHGALRAVEARGHGLGERLDGVSGGNADLARAPRFGTLVRAVEAEVRTLRTTDPLSGVGVGSKPHRLLDVGWLRAADARFELSGVVNRLDRAPFHPGSCGEVRLAYRLAYGRSSPSGPLASKLPATVILELLVPPSGGDIPCADAARAWRAPSHLSGAALGAWLTGEEGPLSPARVATHRLLGVNLNVQTVRWPSTVRPHMAGHAEYLLLAFAPDAQGHLAPKPLENTPDVAKIRTDRRLRAELLRWMAHPEHLAAIDAGTAVLPEPFLARRATSVSPRGLARRHNRPFRQLFEPRELAALDLTPYPSIQSPAALLRRLDQLSCQGCHQSRSVAGFHLLGEDPPGGHGANGLHVAVSPHLGDDLRRRAALTEALAGGAAPDLHAPIAERAEPGERGGPRHAHCGLGDPGFAAWTCEPGLVCTLGDHDATDRDVGVCSTPGPGRAGDACETARIQPNDDGRRDGVARMTRTACAAPAGCDTNEVGFPGGMCFTTCGDAEASPDGVCGGIPVLATFNGCLARKLPFEQCIAETVQPAGLQACDAEHACRDDYVCARTPAGRGACMPPYFLFQLRVDGHPLAH